MRPRKLWVSSRGDHARTDTPTKTPASSTRRVNQLHVRPDPPEFHVLIPATGFSGSRATRKKKTARLFAAAVGEPIAFAGWWDVWGEGSPGKVVAACVVTTEPNELDAAVHDRMPAILPREHYAEWLDPGTDERRLLEMLRPSPADGMTARDVGPAFNAAKNDGPECLAAPRPNGSNSIAAP